MSRDNGVDDLDAGENGQDTLTMQSTANLQQNPEERSVALSSSSHTVSKNIVQSPDNRNHERNLQFDEDITLREILFSPEPTGPGSVEMIDPIHHDPLLQNAKHHFTQSELHEQEQEQNQAEELSMGPSDQPNVTSAMGSQILKVGTQRTRFISQEANTVTTTTTTQSSDTVTLRHIEDKTRQLAYRESRSKEATTTAVAGALSGLLSGTLACPLDVTKTRLQAQGIQRAENLYYRGIFGTMSTIIRDEGFGALYKGVGPIVLGYFSTWMIYFSIYDSSKKYWTSKFPNWNFVSHSCSAITAGAVSATLTNPIWVVKTRLMLQTDMGTSNVHYSGTLDAFRKIVSQEGPRALYSGLLPSLLGLTHVAIHFPVYEMLKVKFHCYGNPSSSLSATDSGNGNNDKGDNPQRGSNKGRQNSSLHVGRLIMASSISKMLASLVTYPHEILRTRMQLRPDPATAKANPHGMIPLLRTTYKNEGIRGLYSGFGVNLFRTVPTSAMTLVSFEYIYNFLSGF